MQKTRGEVMTITGDGEQTRDFVHSRDIAYANIKAMESDKVGKGEAMNIGSGKNHSVNQIAKMIGGAMSYIPPRIEPKHTLADISKAKELLDWEPQEDLEKAIKELK